MFVYYISKVRFRKRATIYVDSYESFNSRLRKDTALLSKLLIMILTGGIMLIENPMAIYSMV